MLTAKLEGGRVRAVPGLEGADCPWCEESVIAKCGSIIVWHFAHKASASRCVWDYEESEWHLNWKANADAHRCEVYKRIGEETARADVIAGDVAIEFQRHSLQLERIKIRERFWDNPGSLASIVWVVDAREAYENRRLRFYPNSGYFHWDGGAKWWSNCAGAVILDTGNQLLLVQTVIEGGKEGSALAVEYEELAFAILDDYVTPKLRTRIQEEVLEIVDRPSTSDGRMRKRAIEWVVIPHIQLEAQSAPGIGKLTVCSSCNWHHTMPMCPKCGAEK